jgi:hypothetical protein
LDKLQHIDNLLRKASQVPANALVDASDWAGIEKRLKRRKNRIYALWFFLALSVCSTSALFLVHQFNSKTQPTITQQEKNIDSPRTTLDLQESRPAKSTETLESEVSSKTEVANTLNSTNQSNSIEDPQEHNTPDAETKITITENSVFESEQTIAQKFEEAIESTPLHQQSKTPKFIFKDIYGFTPLWVNQDKVIVQSISNSKPSHLGYDKSHWETGISFTPSLSSKISGTNKDLSGLINRSYDKFVASSESAAFGNTFGFNAQYHPKGRFFYSSGLFLTQRAEQLDYNYTITEGPSATNDNNLSYDPLDPRAYEYINYIGSNSYHFIEIPLNIGYKQPLSRNFELRTQVGVSYLSLLSSSGKKGNFMTLRLDDLSNLNFNTNHIAANLKSGLYYHRPRVAIGLEPMIGMNLTNLQNKSTSAILDKPYSYGINLTTNFKLFNQ